MKCRSCVCLIWLCIGEHQITNASLFWLLKDDYSFNSLRPLFLSSLYALPWLLRYGIWWKYCNSKSLFKWYKSYHVNRTQTWSLSILDIFTTANWNGGDPIPINPEFIHIQGRTIYYNMESFKEYDNRSFSILYGFCSITDF